MKSQRSRLDRFIARRERLSLRQVQRMIAGGQVELDGERATAIHQIVGQFSRVSLGGRVLQDAAAHYVMLHKPAGVVSATRDSRHRTAVDLLRREHAHTLHIAGRLDFNSTGLLLLTNDGRWSRALSDPASGIAKTYRVELEQPLDESYVDAFARGMDFPYEGITTRPASLKILNEREAEVQLTEGRYHQIKRMFGRFNNRVLTLHRIAVGALALDPLLATGESRDLTGEELTLLGVPHSG